MWHMNKRPLVPGWRLVVVVLWLLSFTACEVAPDESRTVVVVQPSQLTLLWRRHDNNEPYERIAEVVASTDTLPQAASQVALPIAVMNAGIYHPGLVPVGLHIENGQTLRPLNQSAGDGNFFLEPNGVFAITDQQQALVQTTQALAQNPQYQQQELRLATQSGPMLVMGGQLHAAFTPGSASRKVRNGIGVRADGQVVLAVSHTPVNLYDFATWFRDDLHCPNALYLDGTISRLWQTGDEPQQDYPFAGMLVVVPRPD